jgi:hypothetical protein
MVGVKYTSGASVPSISVHPEMVDFARVQGGRQIQTGGILVLFRGFESGAQRRNRVKDAVYGWAPIKILATGSVPVL